MRLRFLPPRPEPLRRLTRAVIVTALDLAAREVRRELRASVAHWSHVPDFRIERQDDDRRLVTTTDPVFLYQDLGTRPHLIRPRRKRALWWATARHPVRLVRHPGTPAMRYTERIAGGMAGRLLAILNDAIAREVP